MLMVYYVCMCVYVWCIVCVCVLWMCGADGVLCVCMCGVLCMCVWCIVCMCGADGVLYVCGVLSVCIFHCCHDITSLYCSVTLS